jgi:hypothetical protein
VTVTDDGAIYLGLRDHVEVLDGQGKRLASWDPLGEEAVLTSIAKYKGHVFVADAGHRVVLHYDLEGNLIDHIGEKDPDRDIPGFIIPSPYFDLAVAPDGLLRVSNPGRNRIEAYTFDGDLELWWGQSGIRIDGFCGCCNPVNFAMLRDGSYVTAEKGLIRVKVYEPDGTFRGVVAGPDQLVAGGAPRVFENPDDAEASGFSAKQKIAVRRGAAVHGARVARRYRWCGRDQTASSGRAGQVRQRRTVSWLRGLPGLPAAAGPARQGINRSRWQWPTIEMMSRGGASCGTGCGGRAWQASGA